MEVNDKPAELNLTAEELDRMKKALKDKKFLEMLRNYAEEISTPENKKRYEEEIKLLEEERGNKVEFIHPEPFRALRTSVNGEQKCFINICGSEKVDKPEGKWGTSEAGRRGQCWSLPHSLHPGRENTDTKGQKVMIYDVVFHPDTLHIASKNKRFMEMVDHTAIEGIQNTFKVTLDKNNMKEMKIKYKGTPQPCVLRKPIPGHKPKEASEEPDPLAFPYPDKKRHTDSASDSKPKSFQIQPQRTKEPTKPKYTIKYRSFIDLQDFRCSRDSAQSPRPKEIVVTIDLPLLKTVTDANLEVTGRHLLLESKKTAYRLELPLAYPVDEDKGEAKFNKQKGQMIITLPVLRSEEALEFVQGLHGGGVSGEKQQGEESEVETTSHREEKEKEGQRSEQDEQKGVAGDKVKDIHDTKDENEGKLKNDKESLEKKQQKTECKNYQEIKQNKSEDKENDKQIMQNKDEKEENYQEIMQNKGEEEDNYLEIMQNNGEGEENHLEVHQNKGEDEENYQEIMQNKGEGEENQPETQQSNGEDKENLWKIHRLQDENWENQQKKQQCSSTLEANLQNKPVHEDEDMENQQEIGPYKDSDMENLQKMQQCKSEDEKTQQRKYRYGENIQEIQHYKSKDEESHQEMWQSPSEDVENKLKMQQLLSGNVKNLQMTWYSEEEENHQEMMQHEEEHRGKLQKTQHEGNDRGNMQIMEPRKNENEKKQQKIQQLCSEEEKRFQKIQQRVDEEKLEEMQKNISKDERKLQEILKHKMEDEENVEKMQHPTLNMREAECYSDEEIKDSGVTSTWSAPKDEENSDVLFPGTETQAVLASVGHLSGKSKVVILGLQPGTQTSEIPEKAIITTGINLKVETGSAVTQHSCEDEESQTAAAVPLMPVHNDRAKHNCISQNPTESQRMPVTDEGRGGSGNSLFRSSQGLSSGSVQREEEEVVDKDDRPTEEIFPKPEPEDIKPQPALLREIDEDGNEKVIRDHSTSAGFIFENTLMFELD